jgi:hypothetical protein
MDVVTATLVLTKIATGGSLVLAGDDLQLPPIHAAEPPDGLEYEVGSVYNYFRHQHEIEPQALQVNYRSNKTIVDLTRTAGYSPKLRSSSPNLSLKLLEPIPTVAPKDWPNDLYWTAAWKELLAPEQPISCFVYEDKLSGQVNEFEAVSVGATAWLLRKYANHTLIHENAPDGKPIQHTTEPYSDKRFWEAGLGIVTPHRAQMAKVIQQLQKLFPASEAAGIRSAVDTVERFQGQERDVIIGSFGVGDPDMIAAEDEFLYDLRRFNVMASRARAKLILFVTRSLLDHLSNDKDVLAESRLLKLAVDTFCNTSTPMTLGYIDNDRVRTIIGRLHTHKQV